MECVVEMGSRAKPWRVCSKNNSSIAQVCAYAFANTHD